MYNSMSSIFRNLRLFKVYRWYQISLQVSQSVSFGTEFRILQYDKGITVLKRQQ